MEPKQRQIVPSSTGPRLTTEVLGYDFVKPRAVTLAELKPDPNTGAYSATKPGVGDQVDTKAEIAKIRADKAEDAEKSAEVKKIVAENADKIARMRAPKPQKKKREEHLSPYKQWKRDYIAKQKASRNKQD